MGRDNIGAYTRRWILMSVVMIVLYYEVSTNSLSRMCRYPTFTQLRSRHTDGRTHVDLESWQCHQERVWRDLGPDFYPRFITDIRCLNTTCSRGNHFCKSVNVYTKVLMKTEAPSCIDVFIPSELRSKWTFQDILVSVYCECSRA